MESLALDERENRVATEVIRGNVPDFYRSFIPIHLSTSLNGTPHSLTYFVAPEYLAIGSQQDYLLMPTTPLLAQRLCDRLGCVLPTRKMVNQIWTNAALKLDPQPISPSPQMTTVPVFAEHNSMVRTQRNQHLAAVPLGKLIAGHKKDIILSSRIYTNFASASVTRPVVIYGWHHATGTPIQPLYNGHQETYADYSHGTRLVLNEVLLDGAVTRITDILTNASLALLISDEGVSEGTLSGVISRPFYPAPTLSPTRILSTQLAFPGQLRFTFSAVPGVSYGIERSADLWNWSAISSLIATGSVQAFSNSMVAPGPAAYYRIKRLTP